MQKISSDFAISVYKPSLRARFQTCSLGERWLEYRLNRQSENGIRYVDKNLFIGT